MLRVVNILQFWNQNKLRKGLRRGRSNFIRSEARRKITKSEVDLVKPVIVRQLRERAYIVKQISRSSGDETFGTNSFFGKIMSKMVKKPPSFLTPKKGPKTVFSHNPCKVYCRLYFPFRVVVLCVETPRNLQNWEKLQKTPIFGVRKNNRQKREKHVIFEVFGGFGTSLF